jgi:hypothetical protein
MNKIIRKGFHACLHGFRFTSNRIAFNFLVDDSWFYETKNAGINKIVGISNGLFHMKHSIRLGWQCINNEIVLYAYAHVGNTKGHVAVELCRVKEGWHTCRIWIHKSYYHVKVGESGVRINDSYNSKIHYLLYPFFGGKDKAPHNIYFSIDL